MLNNGLRVIAHYDPDTPMVTTNLLYDCGARDEDPEATGFAHLFEHLMFGGTPSAPVFDTPVMLAGGENNAFTNNDLTNYYITLPADNIETALWLESDRMRNLDLSESKLEIQKSVVIEEFRQRYLNQPYGDIFLLMRPLAYKSHPYMWPAIGKDISHIERADTALVKKFYDDHYKPTSAILSLAGNIRPDDAFSLAEKWFGRIEGGVAGKRNIPAEREQTGIRELTVSRRVPSAHLMMAFHTGPRSSRSFYIHDLLTDILAGCDSGRLTSELVRRQELFSEADIFLSGEIDPGLVIFSGRVKDGVSIVEAERSVWREIGKVCESCVEPAEFDKARTRYESMRQISYLSAPNKAFSLAFHELLDDADGINSEVDLYMSVTPEEMRDEASATFTRDNCSVIHYLPEKR